MPKCISVGINVRIVDSWPPCCVAVEVKAEPTLPTSLPCAHSSPAWSRKLRIWLVTESNRVGEPKMMASYCRQFVHCRDRRGLVEFEPGLLSDIERNHFGHALDHRFPAADPDALGFRQRHGFDAAIGRIVQNQNLRHLRSLQNAQPSQFRANAH